MCAVKTSYFTRISRFPRYDSISSPSMLNLWLIFSSCVCREVQPLRLKDESETKLRKTECNFYQNQCHFKKAQKSWMLC
jgi:hypothetical protein